MSKSLHDEIMNLPCKRTMSHFATKDELLQYKEGHRDARHAAAELAITADDAQAELNAARALLREVSKDGSLDMGNTNSSALGNRVRAYIDACDKPGEPT